MNKKKYLKLNDIDCYKKSFKLSNYIWELVIEWDWFARKTIGSQFVRAVDSISANIAEGFGRYTKKDKIKFYRYSFASIKESLDWNEKAKKRGLLEEKGYKYVLKNLKELPKEVNQLIKFTKIKLRK